MRDWLRDACWKWVNDDEVVGDWVMTKAFDSLDERI